MGKTGGEARSGLCLSYCIQSKGRECEERVRTRHIKNLTIHVNTGMDGHVLLSKMGFKKTKNHRWKSSLCISTESPSHIPIITSFVNFSYLSLSLSYSYYLFPAKCNEVWIEKAFHFISFNLFSSIVGRSFASTYIPRYVCMYRNKQTNNCKNPVEHT